jgi:hypothetical protein
LEPALRQRALLDAEKKKRSRQAVLPSPIALAMVTLTLLIRPRGRLDVKHFASIRLRRWQV